MPALNEYWSVVSQTVLVLGLALVAEVRRAARKWSYEDRFGRYVSAAGHLLLGVVLVWILNISFVALQSEKGIGEGWALFAQSALLAIGVILIINPILSLALSGSVDLWIVLYLWFPLALPARKRRELVRMEKSLRKIILEEIKLLKDVIATNRALRLMASDGPHPERDIRLAVEAIRGSAEMNDKQAERFVAIFTETPKGAVGKFQQAELRKTSARLAEASGRAVGSGMKALRKASGVRRDVRRTIREGRLRNIPPKIDDRLRRRFESLKDDPEVN